MTGLFRTSTASPAAPQSWELFGDAISTGMLLAALLPLLGIVLVLRHQVFLAASIGQAGNLGIAVALWLGLGSVHGHGHLHGSWSVLAMGLAFAAATGIVSMRALSLHGPTVEARAAWIFLFGGSGAMVLLASAPHGMQEIQRLFLSSLLGVSPRDSYVAGLMLLVAVTTVIGWRRRLWLWAMDPAAAAAYGTSTATCDIVVGGCLGVAIGFAIHATGLLFTFGCTVLPVLFARACAPSLGAVVWMAPLVGIVGCGAGFVLADRADLPPGQATVVLLGTGVALAHAAVAALRRVRPG